MGKVKEQLGFIGMGLMGTPMTFRLLGAGYPVNVWNRSAGKVEPVTRAGAVVMAGIAKVTVGSDVILLSLSDTAAV